MFYGLVMIVMCQRRPDSDLPGPSAKIHWRSNEFLDENIGIGKRLALARTRNAAKWYVRGL
jgi:hypothetical protein